MTAPPSPWEQLDGEHARDFERFLSYLHLGPSRTNVATAGVCGCSEALVRRLAVAWDWKERAAAYDRQRGRKVSDCLLEAVQGDVATYRDALTAYRDQQVRNAEALTNAASLMLQLCVRSVKQLQESGAAVPPASLGSLSAAACKMLEQSSNTVASLLGIDELTAMLDDDDDNPRPGPPLLEPLPGSTGETAEALRNVARA
ncbi:hypothetical protein [Synechococcus sp. CS-1328]|uniref:hypothetical protein n=1 Tax=Synechococcus sp. CS-1328 TaxID=2847976 RepID=UPI00223B277E|nr:hypothetical protein [Synechococcus sp. CS-1328]MCT0225544.1 hypothetical protein [Synechococcus sp. CS-1328]